MRGMSGTLLVGCLSGSALVEDAVMGRSQGSRHWGRHGTQPRCNRSQAAMWAPEISAHGSLTCHLSV